MIEDYNIWETGLSFFLFLNLFLCLSSTLWAGYLFHFRRHLFLKPSILLLTYSCIFFQWPLVFYAGYYEKFLPDPFTFAFLIHAYVLIGFLVSSFILDKKTRIIYKRAAVRQIDQVKVSIPLLTVFSFIILLVTIYYFSVVPFSQTGLYAIFHHPEGSVLAREKSLKLLEDQTLKYVYSIMVSTIAPLTAVMLFFLFLENIKRCKIGRAIVISLALSGLAFAISLTGARISIVNLVLVITFAFIYYHGIPFRPLKVSLIIILVLLVPTILSILRAGETFSIPVVISYLGLVAERTFIKTMDVGSWYAHYFQTEGAFGVSGVPKLATLLGRDFLITPNFIALKYMKRAIASTSADAGYIFTYYSYFGLASTSISLLGLWLLDISILVYTRLNQYLLVPCIASIALSSLSFISSDYTTVWITHGFGFILIVSLVASKIQTLTDKVK